MLCVCYVCVCVVFALYVFVCRYVICPHSCRIPAVLRPQLDGLSGDIVLSSPLLSPQLLISTSRVARLALFGLGSHVSQHAALRRP